jgi:hypothetical protein
MMMNKGWLFSSSEKSERERERAWGLEWMVRLLLNPVNFFAPAGETHRRSLQLLLCSPLLTFSTEVKPFRHRTCNDSNFSTHNPWKICDASEGILQRVGLYFAFLS